MITHEEQRRREPSPQGRWTELLGSYRRTRAAAFARGGEPAAAAESAALGHELALAAPAPIAAGLFDPAAESEAGPGAVAGERDGWVGPLWEVLAGRHRWAELAPLPIAEPVRTLIAHTRILLGEELAELAELGELAEPAARRAGRARRPGADSPCEVPLALRPWEQARWEPADRVTSYRPGGAAATPHFPLPDSREGLAPLRLPKPAVALPGAAQPATVALRGLCEWLEARCVRGTAPQAAALFAPAARDAPVTAGYLPFAAAYPALVRAGSGAGAYGRSGGAARGRLAVWRVLAAMADPSGQCTSAEVDALVARMRCFTWCGPADEIWHLHLALEDPATGLAWAVSGCDYD
ncbi:hypothetical protein [Kitasatospora azatica]|uniref:hypothetical protein n=1 Tax=Kitasatospora azatica TaxID=58347 RepID=UPI0005646E52|nr:hypothetical protein [Kitasatospora azatica]